MKTPPSKQSTARERDLLTSVIAETFLLPKDCNGKQLLDAAIDQRKANDAPQTRREAP